LSRGRTSKYSRRAEPVKEPAETGVDCCRPTGILLCKSDEGTNVKKTVVFAFSGDPACFAHAMLNAMEMKDRGYDIKVVVEGDATKLLSLLRNETKPFADVYRRFRERSLIDSVCRACATKNGVVPVIIEQGLKFGDDMAGHPSMAAYMEQGYEVVTF